MPSLLETCRSLVTRLESLVSGPSPDASAAEDVLTDTKIAFMDLETLPPSPASFKTANSAEERSLALRAYASGVQIWLMRAGSSEFSREEVLVEVERHLNLLKPFLNDFGEELAALDASYFAGVKVPFMGLQLLVLLVQNRLGEFHTFLESISFQDRDQSAIVFVVKLERYLMEGNYEKLLAARSSSPEPMYSWLLGELEVTIQSEIASCFEVSCKDMSIKSAQQLMKLDSRKALEAYAAEFKPEWELTTDRIIFHCHEETKTGIESLPSRDLIKGALNYANELERIV